MTNQYITAIKAEVGIDRKKRTVNFNQNESLNFQDCLPHVNLINCLKLFTEKMCKDGKRVNFGVVNED